MDKIDIKELGNAIITSRREAIRWIFRAYFAIRSMSDFNANQAILRIDFSLIC